MNIYVPLISALVGALIGAAASVVTVIVQARYQTKRELVKDAIALALEDWKTRLSLVTQKGGVALPLAVFVQYHTKLIQLAEQGSITPESIRALNEEQELLIATIRVRFIVKSRLRKPNHSFEADGFAAAQLQR